MFDPLKQARCADSILDPSTAASAPEEFETDVQLTSIAWMLTRFREHQAPDQRTRAEGRPLALRGNSCAQTRGFSPSTARRPSGQFSSSSARRPLRFDHSTVTARWPSPAASRQDPPAKQPAGTARSARSLPSGNLLDPRLARTMVGDYFFITKRVRCSGPLQQSDYYEIRLS